MADIEKNTATAEDAYSEENYWINKLAGELEKSCFPYDFLVSGEIYKRDSVSFEISGEAYARLIKLSNGSDMRLHIILTAAVTLLLAKYTGNEDIIIGTPIYRQKVEGDFINTVLTLRNTVTQEMSFKDLLLQARETVNEAVKNQNYPMEKLLYRLKLQHNVSGFSLFDTVVLLSNVHDKKYIRDINPNTVFSFVKTESCLEGKLEYNPGLYKHATACRIAIHMKNLLQQVLDDVNIGIGDTDILTEEEKETLLSGFNNTDVEYAGDRTLYELFEEQAEKTPDNICVVFKDRQLSYRELNEKSNSLARVLRALRVAPSRSEGLSLETGGVVALMVERSLEMIVGILAVMKAGGAYLPIDPRYPEDRIRFMLEDSGAGILLTHKNLAAGLVFKGEAIDIGDEGLYREEGSNLEKVNRPDDPAYIIYTSGTTGKPKGVIIEHRSISNTIRWRQNEYGLGLEDRVLQLFSYSFDGFLTSFFTPCISGAKTVMLDEQEAKNPIAVKECIVLSKITHFICVPTLYSAVMECLYPGEAAHLRVVTLAGEKVTQNIIIRTIEISSETEIANEYGPTEASVAATAARRLQPGSAVTIGRPISNTKVYILDKNKKMQPIGVSGEMYLSGTGLARGYLNNPGLTAEKFVNNPFVPGQRMYKTGDMARWLPDGNIEYVGRVDNQVKVRGFRIETEEIESRLSRHAMVKNAVVTAIEDEDGGTSLCAYIVPDGELPVSQLREHLSGELPDYMIPAYFMYLEKLPETPNGKIDRKALPYPSMQVEAKYEAPANDTEEKLAAIWAEVLGMEKVGVNDNFFELGGQSLKAGMLISKIHKELNASIQIKDVFAGQTVRKLAKHIASLEKIIYSPIQPVEKREYYPLSSAQKRMLVLNRLEGGIAYNLPGVMIIGGELDIRRLEKVFGELVKRHDAFRTSFEIINGEPVQMVHEDADFKVVYKDACQDRVEDIVKDFVRPFHLNKAPLLRVGLVRLAESRNLLMFDMHHIIADGISLDILIGEFIALYEGRELPPLRVQYKDFTVWQNEQLQSVSAKKQEEYWLGVFKGNVPELNMPTDFARPSVPSFDAAALRFEADRELAEGLGRLAEETGTTLFMVLLAAYNVLLFKYTGQEDIVVGSPVAGRPHADLEHVIGMLVNTLAIRNYPRKQITFKEFLKEVKESSMAAYENQDYPLEELVNKLKIDRDSGRNPLFDTIFVMQNMDIRDLKIGGLTFENYEFENRMAKFDFELQAAEREKKIAFLLEYRTGLFRKETAENITRDYLKILSSIVGTPDVKIQDIELEREFTALREINLDGLSFRF